MFDFKTLQSNPLISYTTIKPVSITNPIYLSQKEIQIFDLFKEIIKEKNLNNIELRVAGGWVRDHLLNIPNNDLDITIKGIDPKIFSKFLNEKVNRDKYIIANYALKGRNGLKIDLTKTEIYGVLIDFVELKENAFDDAKRRDFTFNSLFYNILDNKIEDLLKLGVDDLKNGFIRSCATTQQKIDFDSFHIMRMLRFATKYQFIIDDKYLNDIINNKKIFQNDLLKNIAKEIIHKELNLIFSCSNPSFAISSLYKLDLLKYVLHIDNNFKNIYNKRLFSEKDLLNCVNIFIVGRIIFDKYKSYFDEETYDNNYKISFYSILLTIYMKNFTNKNKNILTKVVLANVLKLKDRNFLKIINQFDDFNNFFVKNEYNKLNVGLLLRKILVGNLSIIIFISVAYEYVIKINSDKVLDKLDCDELEKIFQKYYEFYKYMNKENLQNADEIKPIIDGKRIINEFPNIPIRYIGDIINTIINKQLETNYNFSEEDAINLINSKIKELNIK